MPDQYLMSVSKVSQKKIKYDGKVDEGDGGTMLEQRLLEDYTNTYYDQLLGIHQPEGKDGVFILPQEFEFWRNDS